ncbi:MAG: hypothetical protein CVU11_12920 [Bacteroidetes bacterium HGW-Bacteroidetes-6]|nr:MAG: hypothetical protein CVU11_12920 [Bacteroidetes bacterium HGW-Bacteroidetes-6]
MKANSTLSTVWAVIQVLIVFFAALMLSTSLLAGNPASFEFPDGGSVSGRIADKESGQPVAYANVALFSSADSSIAGGCITDSTGHFSIGGVGKGNYYIRITFVGYGEMLINNITVSAKKEMLDLGLIGISPSDISLNGVNIVAEKPLVEYHLDKQVINAEAVQNAATGTAIDILRNSPSITIDNDDNISLRGNQGFILLINSIPAVQSARDALRQIPASMVQRIEIITNPSARYDAEGVSGIINVVLKQKKDDGFGALVNVRAGLFQKYGFDVSVNYNKKKWSLNGSVALSSDQSESTSYSERNIYNNDSTQSLVWNSVRNNKNAVANIRLSADYQINSKQTLSFGGEAGYNLWQMDMSSDYTESLPGTENSFYKSDYTSKYPGIISGANAKYTAILDTSGGKFEAGFATTSWAGDIALGSSTFLSDNSFERLDQTTGTDYLEDAAVAEYTVNIDFTKMLLRKIKMETGYQYTYRPFNGDFQAQNYNGTEWQIDSAKTTDEWFLQRKNAGYLMLSRQFKAFEMQAGIRAEDYYSEFFLGSAAYTDVTMHDLFWFPSLHISKAISPKSRWQASYSRRVNYPQDWMLGPTPMYSDGFLYQEGNAGLRPELVDSYELTHIHLVGKGIMLNLTGFYRQINGEISRTMNVNDAGILVVGWDNLSTTRSYGLETGTNVKISKVFSANIAGGAYGVRNNGILSGDTVSSRDISWNARMMLNTKITASTKLQLTGFYNAASFEQQGYRSAQMLVGLSLRQDFMKGKLSATLNCNDLFNTFRWEYAINNAGYDTYIDFTPEYPRISFALAWKINNYKPQQNTQQNLNPAGGGGM